MYGESVIQSFFIESSFCFAFNVHITNGRYIKVDITVIRQNRTRVIDAAFKRGYMKFRNIHEDRLWFKASVDGTNGKGVVTVFPKASFLFLKYLAKTNTASLAIRVLKNPV